MDFNNLNTRVVFKEPRGMVRWIQLVFSLLALTTVMNFWTSVGVDITCPPAVVPTNSTTAAPSPNSAEVIHPKLEVSYPFDFSNMVPINNSCSKGNNNYTYTHNTSLHGSPFLFTMTAVLSLMYAMGSLLLYLLFSANYDTAPMLPVVDLIITGVVCLFWIIATISFNHGASLIESTATYDNLKQVLCPPQFLSQPGTKCEDPNLTSWKSLNIGIVSGYTSFLIWGAGLWFVFKETHFHQPREQFTG